MPWILHIEGIPGSEKTTGARQLEQHCGSMKLDSCRVAEETADHPFAPASLRADSGPDEFAKRCLVARRDFVIGNDLVAIPDGFALQSTIRFLFAKNVPDERNSA